MYALNSSSCARTEEILTYISKHCFQFITNNSFTDPEMMEMLENADKDVSRRTYKGTLQVLDRTGNGNVENTVPDEGNENTLFWKIKLHSLL